MTIITKKLLLLPAFIAALMISAVSHASDLRTHILEASDAKKTGEYVRARFLKQVAKPFNTEDKRRKMLIMGDSHAQDFYNALAENKVDKRYQIRTRRVPAICGVYLGPENISGLIDKKHTANCQKSDTLANAMPQIQEANVVILAANWKLWSAERLSTTVKNLKIKGSQKLFVVGRKNFGKINLRQFLRMPESKLKTLRNPVNGAQQETNRVMKKSLSKAVFVDIQRLICRSEDDCPLFTPQVRLISFDGGHLTQEGARYIGGVLLQHPPLNQL